MKNAGQHKSLQEAQAAERQSRGELLRRVLDQFAEVEMANGSRFPEDGPLFASGPDGPCIELFKLADQLAHNRQLAEAAARWREIQQQVAQGNRFGDRD